MPTLRDLRVVPEPDNEMSEEIPTSSQSLAQSTYYAGHSSPPEQVSLKASRVDAMTQALEAKGFSAFSLALFLRSHKLALLGNTKASGANSSRFWICTTFLKET